MTIPTISEDLIQALPKTDLHLHLDGSLRIGTLIELAQEQNVPLPSYTEEGLKETIFKERYANLGEYLSGFQYTVAVLQNTEALERCAYELACDNFNEGVRYIEIRFAPQLHARPGMDMASVLRHVNRGLEKAKKEFNQSHAIQDGYEPPFEYGIIVCAMRMFTESFSEYFRRLRGVHTYTPQFRLFGLASIALAESIVEIKQNEGLPIVGFDLAGQEDGYPAEDHIQAFQHAHKHFINKTVHAGEAYGPESIFQAITDLYADRIGHGYHLFSHDLIKREGVNKKDYINNLVQYISDRRVTIEVCLTSNMQTMPELNRLADHSFGKMLQAKMSMTICTDNRTVSNTTVSKEIGLAIKHFNLSPKQLRQIIIHGFKRSFFPKSYIEKRAYVRKVIDYYSSIEKQFGIHGHQANYGVSGEYDMLKKPIEEHSTS